MKHKRYQCEDGDGKVLKTVSITHEHAKRLNAQSKENGLTYVLEVSAKKTEPKKTAKKSQPKKD